MIPIRLIKPKAVVIATKIKIPITVANTFLKKSFIFGN
jgi:hypothetical protein